MAGEMFSTIDYQAYCSLLTCQPARGQPRCLEKLEKSLLDSIPSLLALSGALVLIMVY